MEGHRCTRRAEFRSRNSRRCAMTNGPRHSQHQENHNTHPRHSNGISNIALGDRRSEMITAVGAFGCARGRRRRPGLPRKARLIPELKKHQKYGAGGLLGWITARERHRSIFSRAAGRPCPCHSSPHALGVVVLNSLCPEWLPQLGVWNHFECELRCCHQQQPT